MRLLSTYHPPSSVIASVHCHLTGHTGDEISHLAIARPTRVDVHATTKAGLEWRAGIDIWGVVVDVRAARPRVSLSLVFSDMAECELILVGHWQGTTEDVLLVLTDHPNAMMLVLQYLPLRGSNPAELKVLGSQKMHERTLRHAEFTSSLYVSFPSPSPSSGPTSSTRESMQVEGDEDEREASIRSKMLGDIVIAAPHVGKLHATKLEEDDYGDVGVPDSSELKCVLFLLLTLLIRDV